VWLDFPAPHKHFIAYDSVTSARTNFSVPVVGAPLPLPSSMAMGLNKLVSSMMTSTFRPPLARAFKSFHS
jgi:hypothetical protein